MFFRTLWCSLQTKGKRKIAMHRTSIIIWAIVWVVIWLLVSFIYSSYLFNNVTDVKHRAIIVTQTHFWRCRLYHVRLFFRLFSPVYAVVNQAPVLFSTPHKEPVRKLALSFFPRIQRCNAHFGHRTSNLTITCSAL